MTTDQPHSDTIVLEFDELPTESAVLAELETRNPKAGDIVAISVKGDEVTSAVVVEGEGGAPVGIRLTDSLAPE